MADVTTTINVVFVKPSELPARAIITHPNREEPAVEFHQIIGKRPEPLMPWH